MHCHVQQGQTFCKGRSAAAADQSLWQKHDQDRQEPWHKTHQNTLTMINLGLPYRTCEQVLYVQTNPMLNLRLADP